MSKCIIVAELGINHNGDIDLAKKMIDIAKLAGCDYVKFQKRTIDKVYTKEELEKPRESPWGTTFGAQKEGLEFNREQYDEIARYCKERKIEWFISPWDVESVWFLMGYALPFIKVASACITNFELLGAIKETSKDVILSTGMSTKEEVEQATNFLGDQVKYILACTSTYPTKSTDINLKKLQSLKEMYPGKKVGFSNHHPGILFAASSVLLGAEMVEFHQTLDRAMYGSDQAASIETPGVFKLVDYIRSLEQAKGDGSWTITDTEQAVKKKLRR